MFFSPKTKTGLEFSIYKVSAFLQTNLDLVLEMFLNIFPNQTVFGLETGTEQNEAAVKVICECSAVKCGRN